MSGSILSSTTDLTALVGVFPDGTGFDVLPEFFVPAERIAGAGAPGSGALSTNGRADGLITATPGNVVDYEYVRQTLHGLGG